MDQESAVDLSSGIQHIDEGETWYQPEEGNFEVIEEQKEDTVREKEYGEVKETEDDIITENTEEEVYGEDEKDEQVELQDKGINEIQTESSDTVTSDNLLSEKTKEMVIQESLQIEEDGDRDEQVELQDEPQKETNEIQTEPSDTVTSDNLLTEEMVIQDTSQIEEDREQDDKSFSPPLGQSQFNKENTPDYLEEEERKISRTPPSKKITPNLQESKGKRRSSEKFKPTVVKPFNFSLDKRVEDRQKYNDKMNRVRNAQEEREKLEKQRREKEEEEELKLERRRLVPKANPIRHYNPIMITPSKKPLTLPDGPNLILESRKRTPKVGDRRDDISSQENKIKHVL